MNREHVSKAVFIIGTLLTAGFVSWLTKWEFGVVWYAIAIVSTDLTVGQVWLKSASRTRTLHVS